MVSLEFCGWLSCCFGLVFLYVCLFVVVLFCEGGCLCSNLSTDVGLEQTGTVQKEVLLFCHDAVCLEFWQVLPPHGFPQEMNAAELLSVAFLQKPLTGQREDNKHSFLSYPLFPHVPFSVKAPLQIKASMA